MSGFAPKCDCKGWYFSFPSGGNTQAHSTTCSRHSFSNLIFCVACHACTCRGIIYNFHCKLWNNNRCSIVPRHLGRCSTNKTSQGYVLQQELEQGKAGTSHMWASQWFAHWNSSSGFSPQLMESGRKLHNRPVALNRKMRKLYASAEHM